MLKDFILFIKYPYTAGVIATIWLGTVGLIAIDVELPIVRMTIINMAITCVIAVLGFRGKQEM
jgi:hypothetical protein